MAFSDPKKIIEEFGINEGQIVADLGTGTGFYAIAAAHAVGEHGKVYAVDIQQGLLARLKTLARTLMVHNIVDVIHGDIEHPGGTRIKDNAVDVAIVANVLFQVENKDQCIDEVRRILRPNGRVLLVDWTDSFGGVGPQGERVVLQQAARELFEKKGFEFSSAISAGDHHYGLIFRKH